MVKRIVTGEVTWHEEEKEKNYTEQCAQWHVSSLYVLYLQHVIPFSGSQH